MATNRKPADAELTRQLDGTGSEPLEAVFQLRLGKAPKAKLDPHAVEQAARRALDRVQLQVGHGPERVNVFKNLGRFVVRADSSFIEALLQDDEIASAQANIQPTTGPTKG